MSVAMCTRDGQEHIADQLSSIIAQTRLPDELVIRDDRSTDATVDVIREMTRDLPFETSILVNDTVLGVVPNFTAAIQAAAGDIIVLADQDDCWLPHRLAAVEAAFERSRSTTAVFSDAQLIDANGELMRGRLWDAFGLDRRGARLLRTGRVLEQLCRWNIVTGAALSFRAELKTSVFPVPRGALHDEWIALVAALCGEVEAVSAPLLQYRLHARNVVGVPSESLRTLAGTRSGDAGVRDAELAVVEEALRRGSVWGASTDRLLPLQRRAKLLASRASLAERPASRLGSVFANLVTGRYHRSAHGWRSAAHDLVFGR